MAFYVAPNRTQVYNFAIYIHVSGCGNYKITKTPYPYPLSMEGFRSLELSTQTALLVHRRAPLAWQD